MSRIIFSKYSNERARRFSIRTDICQEQDGSRIVKKRAAFPEAKSHVEQFPVWYEKLSALYADSQIKMNRCKRCDGGVELEYLNGPTLEHVLDTYLAEGQIDRVVTELEAYLKEVKKGFTEKFVMTSDFAEVFGERELPENLTAANTVDIDMVLNNVIVDEGKTLIDYEWTFDFPIPYNFVVYRILLYYCQEASGARRKLEELRLMRHFGITEEEEKIYWEMELHFQERYLLSEGRESKSYVPLRLLYDDISPGSVEIEMPDSSTNCGYASRQVQVFQSENLGFSEENSKFYDCVEQGVCDLTVEVKEGLHYVRIDPCSKICAIQNLKLLWGDKNCRFQTNGIEMEDGRLYFSSDDPQIILKKPLDAGNILHIRFQIQYLNLSQSCEMLKQVCAKQKDLLTVKEAQIRQMENTKVWKFYQAVKKDYK